MSIGETVTKLDPPAVVQNDPANAVLSDVVNLSEITALIRFVNERGLDNESKITAPLVCSVAALAAAADQDERAAKCKEVVELYGRLTALTYPTLGVNGRTVLDSDNYRSQRKLLKLVSYRPRATKSLIWLVGAFLLAVITESMRLYYGTQGPYLTANGWIQSALETAWVYDLYRLLLLYMQPFFWGAVGASVYLLKHTADLAAARQYDSQSAQGVSTRVLLGGVFGAVIVHLFFGRLAESGSTISDLSPSAVAFLSGLGIRAIYAAFEKVIDTVTDWISKLGGPKASSSSASV